MSNARSSFPWIVAPSCAQAFAEGAIASICMRLAGVLATCWPDGQARMQRAIELSDDPLDRAAAVVALLHAQQETLFEEAQASLQSEQFSRMDFAAIAARPLTMRDQAAAALDLPPTAVTEARISSLLGRHAKASGAVYSAVREAEANAAVESHHAGRFDAALQWLGRDCPQALSGAASR